jgi:hypothetical protein
MTGQSLNELVLTPFQLLGNFSVRLPSSRYLNGLTASECFIMVTVLDSKGATSNLTQLLTVTRNHILYTQYMVTIDSFNAKLWASNSSHMVIAAGLETLFFYQAMKNLNQNREDFMKVINEQYERLAKQAQDTTLDFTIRETTSKVANILMASGFNIESAVSSAEAEKMFEQGRKTWL